MGIGTGHLGWIFNPVGFGSGVGHRQLGVCGDFGEQGQAAIPRQGAHHWFVFGGGDTHHHVGKGCAPLNKLWNSSRNRTNVYEVVRAQVVSGGLPMSLAIVGEVRFSTDVFYLVSLIGMLIVVLVYLIVDDKESDLDA